MEKTGLLYEMADAVFTITKGRTANMTAGTAEAGRAGLEKGFADVLALFKEAAASGDSELLLTAEYAYAAQELHEGREDERVANQSSEAAMRMFESAFHALEIVKQDALYQAAEKTYPLLKKHRYGKDARLPNDAYHCAFSGNGARLKNRLSNHGLWPEEITLLEFRRSLCVVAQTAYAALQRKALGLPEKDAGRT